MDMSFCDGISIEKGGRNLIGRPFEGLKSLYPDCLKSTVGRRTWVFDHEIPLFLNDRYYLNQLLVKG